MTTEGRCTRCGGELTGYTIVGDGDGTGQRFRHRVCPVTEQPRNDADLIRSMLAGGACDCGTVWSPSSEALAALSRLVEAAEQAQRERDEARDSLSALRRRIVVGARENTEAADTRHIGHGQPGKWPS